MPLLTVSPSTFRLGVDIGGTFTDIVLLGDDGSVRTKKVLSTPDDYARAVVAGATALLSECRVDGPEVVGVVHASTVASNTILEGRGARTALITTEGFRDVLEMRRLRIPVLYDVQYESVKPLVPRRLRYEVAERLGPRGEVWLDLDEATVEDVARKLRQKRETDICIRQSIAFDKPTNPNRRSIIFQLDRPHSEAEFSVTFNKPGLSL